MGKLFRWAEAVIANSNTYANLGGVDIQKSAERLFESDDTEKAGAVREPDDSRDEKR